MKYEGFEGTTEEFDNFTKTDGFTPSDFFRKNKTEIHIMWIAAPSILFIVCVLINIFFTGAPKITTAASVIALCSAFWLAISSHIQWKLQTVTGLIPVMAITILLVSTSDITIAGALEKAEKFTQECTKED